MEAQTQHSGCPSGDASPGERIALHAQGTRAIRTIRATRHAQGTRAIRTIRATRRAQGTRTIRTTRATSRAQGTRTIRTLRTTRATRRASGAPVPLLALLTLLTLLTPGGAEGCGGGGGGARPDGAPWADAGTGDGGAGANDAGDNPDAQAHQKAWWPYSATSSWPSIHGGPFNSDYNLGDPQAPLETAWHVLQGTVTFTAPIPDEDHGLVYVTTARAGVPNLLAFALEDGPWGASGQLAWSATDAQGHPAVSSGAISGSPVLDADGNVYVGDQEALWSFDVEGRLRWRTDLPVESDGQTTASVPFLSLLFVPTGQVGGITTAGRLLLFDRGTGELVADHQLSGALPFSAQSGDATGLGAQIMTDCLWVNPQDQLMMDDLVRMRLFAGFLGVDMAVSNTPAVWRVPEEQETHGEEGRIFIPALLQSTDGDGNHDLRLFRIDVSQEDGQVVVTERSDFDGLVPGGAGSATSPTVTSDGHRVIVGDNLGVLHAFDGDTGQEQWQAVVGDMLGSVTVDWPQSRLIYVGTGDQIRALDATSGAVVWSQSLAPLADARLAPVGSDAPVAVVDGIVLASPGRLMVPVILGYQRTLLASAPPLLWPMQALLLTLDKSGVPLQDPAPLPDVSDTGAVTTRSGKVVVTLGATPSSVAHCLWRNYPALVHGLPEPMEPVGGVVVLRPQEP